MLNAYTLFILNLLREVLFKITQFLLFDLIKEFPIIFILIDLILQFEEVILESLKTLFLFGLFLIE